MQRYEQLRTYAIELILISGLIFHYDHRQHELSKSLRIQIDTSCKIYICRGESKNI